MSSPAHTPYSGRRADRFGVGTRTSMLATALLCVAVALLRMPAIGAPLGIDEGGMTVVGVDWLRSIASGHAGTSLYGDLWIDRPPLLLALYGTADLLGGQLGVRVLGLVAAMSCALLAGGIAKRLAGPRAWWPAALSAGVLLSSPAIDGDRTAGELLAAVPVAVSLLLLVTVIHADAAGRMSNRVRLVVLVGAGAAAASAPLIKQSALDACVAAAAWCVFRMVMQARTRAAWWLLIRDAASFVVGMLTASLITVAATVRGGTSLHELGYALFGFRIDVLTALGKQTVPPMERAQRLLEPALASGLIVLAVLLPIAVFVARRGPSKGAGAVLLAGWSIGAVIGVAGGGYYWAHYLLQLAPPLGVAAGVAMAGRSRAATGLLVLVLAGSAVTGQIVRADATPPEQIVRAGYHPSSQRPAVAIGEFVRRNSRPDDRVAVLYARANVAYYADREPATPYLWSSMYRALPGAQEALLDALRGPHRAAWVAQWNRTTSYGMDRDGRIAATIAANYRRVADICGKPVYVRADRALPVVVLPAARCVQAGPEHVYGGQRVVRGFDLPG